MKRLNKNLLDFIHHSLVEQGQIENWTPRQTYDFVYKLASNKKASSELYGGDLPKLLSWAQEGSNSKGASKFLKERNTVFKIKQYFTKTYRDDLKEMEEKRVSSLAINTPIELLANAKDFKAGHDFHSIIKSARSITYTPKLVSLSRSGEFRSDLENTVATYDRLVRQKGVTEANHYLNNTRMKSASLVNYLREGILRHYIPEIKKTYGRRKSDG